MDALSEKQCRTAVQRRSGGLCERCSRGGNLTMHHRKKRGQGGPWSPENIVHVCGHGTVGCHGWIESHPLLASAGGWHVRPWEDPASIPIQPVYGPEFYLRPDGSTSDQALSSL